MQTTGGRVRLMILKEDLNNKTEKQTEPKDVTRDGKQGIIQQ